MARKNVIRALAGTACALLVAGAAGPGAAAVTMEDSGDVQATVRKTVLQTATATGEILTSRMYTQVSAVGNGTKTVLVPVGTTSNRNLNEFGAFPMEGESIQFDLTVDGGVEERTLTDADINPMEVSVKVTLDGVEIQPEDVVGASGVLDVQYTVRNTTATTSPITYADVEGTEITEDLETAEPYVGALDVTLPQGFNEVTAPGATIAGNGQNQTSLGYSFVLFPPLGSTEVTVGYQARIDGGVMPPADFSFLPIVPFENGVIAGTTDAYRGGAAVGAQIFGAGTEIGDNLLLLQDGASQLVSGLGQLAAGAVQLSDGLVNTAAPGSAELAAGADTLSEGLNELNSQIPALEEGVGALDAGANDVSDGLNQLDAQVPALESGANQLNDGAQLVAGGLNQLNSQVPALEAGAQQLDDGAQQLAAGMAQLNGGLKLLDSTFNGLAASVYATPEYQGLQAGLAGLKQGLEDSKTLLTDAQTGLGQIEGALTGASNLIDLLQGNVGTTCDATCQVYMSDSPTGGPAGGPGAGYLVGAANAGAADISSQIPGAIDDADAGIAVIGDPSTPGRTLAYGVQALVQAIQDSITGSADYQSLIAGAGKLDVGAQDLAAGTAQLSAQVPALAAGVDQLATGAGDLADGTSALSDQVPALAAGVGQLAAGGELLAEGTGELNSKVPPLASGVQQLDDGGELVADGTNQLADGLGAAADGSEQLVDGLSQAEPGGAQIEQGAGDLKEQGADVLAQTGKDAQIDYARNIALLEASQQAGLEGAGIPFGSAVGTDVVTTAAVQMQLAGIAPDTENNALKFGLGALLIAGAGGAAFAAARKVAA